MTDAAAWFMGIGFALALAVALVLAAAGKRLRSRAAVLEALAAVTLIGAGAVVARGLFAGLESGAAGLIEVVAGVAVGLGLALRRPFLSRPSYWIIPVAMVAAPVMLARFVVGGEFRVSDVAAAFIAVGVVMAIALILAAPPLRRTLARLRLRQPRTLLVLAIAAIGIGVAASWAVLISAGATRVSVIAAVPFGAIYVALSIALWRWLKGDSITSFTVGLVTPLGAAGAAGAVLVALIGSLFSAGPATPFVFESIAAIGLCGILFAVLTIQPPRRGDPGAPKGRAMQFRWEDDEIARPSPSVSPPVAPVS
jgi:hypothetical protein